VAFTTIIVEFSFRYGQATRMMLGSLMSIAASTSASTFRFQSAGVSCQRRWVTPAAPGKEPAAGSRPLLGSPAEWTARRARSGAEGCALRRSQAARATFSAIRTREPPAVARMQIDARARRARSRHRPAPLQYGDFARCSADAVQLPELLRCSITSLELPPETRVDVLTVQRIRRGSNHTFGEKDKKQEGGEGMVKSDFAERNSEQITDATRTGVDWVQELTEQNIRQAQAMVIKTRKVADDLCEQESAIRQHALRLRKRPSQTRSTFCRSSLA